MITVVLSATESCSGFDRLRQQLDDRGGAVRWYDLTRMVFSPCLACSGCERTGRCVLEDPMTEIVTEILACDRLILITPVFLGVHSPTMKKAVDRFLPLAGERFTMRAGEMHHQTRATHPPSLIGVGVLEKSASTGEAETFERLIDRHAVNWASPRHAALVARKGTPLDHPSFTEALDRTGARR